MSEQLSDSPEIMGLYGLFDRVDGEFNNGFELLENDERASISLAKTFAIGKLNIQEFELRHVANINVKNGSVFPVVPYVVDFNKEVYERASAILSPVKEVKENVDA